MLLLVAKCPSWEGLHSKSSSGKLGGVRPSCRWTSLVVRRRKGLVKKEEAVVLMRCLEDQKGGMYEFRMYERVEMVIREKEHEQRNPRVLI